MLINHCDGSRNSALAILYFTLVGTNDKLPLMKKIIYYSTNQQLQYIFLNCVGRGAGEGSLQNQKKADVERRRGKILSWMILSTNEYFWEFGG